MPRFLRFERVCFSHPGMTRPLLEEVQAHFPPGWTGIVGPNGAGKTTLLRLASGALAPAAGRIQPACAGCYVEQRTDAPPTGLRPFLESDDPVAQDWRRRLGLQAEWAQRWETLSHGERKRAQIGAALWTEPEVLALDEPTNHIDAAARALLLDALRRFRGVGLLVSHDRELLDALCGQCLFIDPPGAVLRPGGVTAGASQARIEQASARERDSGLRQDAERLRSAAQQRREQGDQVAARQKAARSRKIPVHDHDGRAKRQLARLTGKDVWAARQSAALGRRAGKSAAERATVKVRKEYAMGFWLPGSACSTRNAVLQAPAGEIALGPDRRLRFPDLRLGPCDRVALTGPNGAGKSTLLRALHPFLRVPPERLIEVPQEIDAAQSRSILEEVATLPREARGRVMTSVSRLGSRPGRLLESAEPSPGEVRKILLALGVDRGPHLIVMDEPTNHMDLPSISCLEEALAECPCALLLVSHDICFLDRLVEWHWRLEASPGDPVVQLRITPWEKVLAPLVKSNSRSGSNVGPSGF